MHPDDRRSSAYQRRSTKPRCARNSFPPTTSSGSSPRRSRIANNGRDGRCRVSVSKRGGSSTTECRCDGRNSACAPSRCISRRHPSRTPSEWCVPLALRLTALTLLLRPMGPWTVRPLILLCAGVALLSPRALLRPLTWYALAALIALRIAADWPIPDNHIYLLAYWCLAAALALGAGNGGGSHYGKRNVHRDRK